MSKPVILSRYGKRHVRLPEVRVPDPVCTSQEFKDDCNPNVIIERFTKHGTLPDGSSRPPLEGDFSSVGSFDDAMNLVISAQSQFDALPSKIRSRFDNDPRELIRFMSDASNETEAVSLGLVAPKLQPDPAPKGGQQAVPAAGGDPVTK